MNTDPLEDRSEPSVALEDLVFQLAEEVKRLRKVQFPDVPPAGDVENFLDQESFRRFEELLKEAVGAVRPRSLSARLVHGLAPQQKRTMLLMLEMLTMLFENYRALAYRASDLSRFCSAVQNQMTDLKRMMLEQQLRTEERFKMLGDQLGNAHVSDGK